MLQKMLNSFRRFMYDRAGVDQLCWVLIFAGLVVNIVAISQGLSFLLILAYAAEIISFWRMFSKNVEKRRAENQKLLQFWSRLRDREHKYYACPKCKQPVRVPKGKGTINIKCPKCGEKFQKKT